MSNNQQTNNPKVSPLCSLLAFTLLVALGCFADVDAQWTTPDGSGNINNTNTNNVGIGTTTPTALLEVKKSQNAGTGINLDNPFTTASNTAFSILSFKQGGANRFHIASINDNNTTQTGGAGAVQFWNFNNGPMLFATNNAEQMRITPTGFVGIGTTVPDVKLQVHHSSANTNLANIGLADLVLGLRNTSNTNGNMSVISFQDASGYGNVNITALQKDQVNHSGDLLFFTRTNSTTYGERMRITSTGNLGVGVVAPTEKLQVAGTVRFENSDGTGPVIFARTTGATGYPTTTSAGYPLVMSNRLYLRDLTSGAASSINALGTVDLNASAVAGVGPVALRVTGSADNNNPTLQTRNSSGTPTVTVLGTGNVGIGTTSPTKPLDVVGDINASGTITGGNVKAKYQDVAEWVDSSQELPAGTVVILDPTKSNQVIASTQSYDSRVAGVISLRPGLTLGEEGEGRVLVATTGRVRVKVDATNGPIQIGDLLVTSDKTGVAMKSVPVDIGGIPMHRPGTLIGKALEPLAQGTGEILVLLSLQ